MGKADNKNYTDKHMLCNDVVSSLGKKRNAKYQFYFGRVKDVLCPSTKTKTFSGSFYREKLQTYLGL